MSSTINELNHPFFSKLSRLSCLLSNVAFDNGKKITSNKSEDDLLKIVQMMEAIMKMELSSSTFISTAKLAQAPALLPIIAHTVSTLLDLITDQKLLELRRVAISTLSVLLFDLLLIQGDGIMLYFFPGIVSKLSKVFISASTSDNHKLLCDVLNLLKSVIMFTLCDARNSTFLEVEITSFSQLKTTPEYENSLVPEYVSTTIAKKMATNSPPKKTTEIPVVCRNSEWYKSTTSKLNTFLSQLFVLKTSLHWKVSQALSELASDLILNCHNAVKESIPIMLDILSLNICNDVEQVRQVSFQFASMLNFCQNSSSSSMVSESVYRTLKNNFQKVVSEFPERMNSLTGTGKSVLTSLLVGYSLLLGRECDSLFSASMQEISQGLLQVVKVRTNVLEHCEQSNPALRITNQEMEFDSNLLTFSNFEIEHGENKDASRNVRHFCRIMGKLRNPRFVIDFFLSSVIARLNHTHNEENNFIQCNTTLWILNNVLLGMVDEDDFDSIFSLSLDTHEMNSKKQIDKAILFLLREYVDILFQHSDNSSINFHYGEPPGKNIIKSQHVIVFQSLLITGLHQMATILGPKMPLQILRDTLYILLDKCGSPYQLIQTASIRALTQMCKSNHYTCLSNLLMDHIDFVINMTTTKLKYFSNFSAGNQNEIQEIQRARVMATLLKLVGMKGLEIMDHTMMEILFDIADEWAPINTKESIYIVKTIFEVVFSVAVTLEQAVEPSNTESQNLIVKCPNSFNISCETLFDYCQHNIEVMSKKEMEFLTNWKWEIPKTDNLFHFQNTQENININESNIDNDSQENSTLNENGKSHIEEILEIILKRSQYFTTSPSSSIRILTFKVVSSAIFSLSNLAEFNIKFERSYSTEEEPTKVFPFLHLYWNIVLNRIQFDDNPAVVLECFSTLNRMIPAGSSFLRARVKSDLWPLLLRHLKSLSSECEKRPSLNQRKGATSVVKSFQFASQSERNWKETTTSFLFKLLVEMLLCVERIVMDIPEQSLDILRSVVEVCIQSSNLLFQEKSTSRQNGQSLSSMNSVLSLIDHILWQVYEANEDIVWHAMYSLLPEEKRDIKEIVPIDQGLKEVYQGLKNGKDKGLECGR